MSALNGSWAIRKISPPALVHLLRSGSRRITITYLVVALTITKTPSHRHYSTLSSTSSSMTVRPTLRLMGWMTKLSLMTSWTSWPIYMKRKSIGIMPCRKHLIAISYTLLPPMWTGRNSARTGRYKSMDIATSSLKSRTKWRSPLRSLISRLSNIMSSIRGCARRNIDPHSPVFWSALLVSALRLIVVRTLIARSSRINHIFLRRCLEYAANGTALVDALCISLPLFRFPELADRNASHCRFLQGCQIAGTVL